MRKTLESFSEKDTAAIGEKIGSGAVPGSVYALNGDLGTGKTVFTKGFGRGLGISEVINSPTFTILKTYHSGRMPLYHFDVYRIGDISEMDEIGYEDCFFGEGVSLVEWADNIKEIMPEDTTYITIKKDIDKGPDFREIIIENTEK